MDDSVEWADRLRAVACALFGHSRICCAAFRYRYCGRCGAQLGDGLAAVDPGAPSSVIVGCGCATCRDNTESLTWRDRLFLPAGNREA